MVEHDVRVASGRIASVTMDHGVMKKVMRRDLEAFCFFVEIIKKFYSPGSLITCLLIGIRGSKRVTEFESSSNDEN